MESSAHSPCEGKWLGGLRDILEDLSALPTDVTSQLEVLGHDGDSLGVGGAQIGVLKPTPQVSLTGLLSSHDSRALKHRSVLKSWAISLTSNIYNPHIYSKCYNNIINFYLYRKMLEMYQTVQLLSSSQWPAWAPSSPDVETPVVVSLSCSPWLCSVSTSAFLCGVEESDFTS